ncbi:MarR family transcriptional regulator [Thermosipho ferrireducens]|uniref:MarR family transcriptional regulator n=1 Tax=Thermosipho ferrireducens TaxID=2571116 RepID=A0ABX7S9E1_9BACT|nr:MarR family transcriptional regulator [Thermosipho ferrireducens]QTA37815.1 MarR family transcriptional regulator [Thermosipho ferrireducens]
MAKNLEKILREICFKIKVKGREVLKDYPITPAQFDLMQNIYFKGPKTMSELSKALGIAKSTTTGLVFRLEKDGFLTKTRMEKDKRIHLVTLTNRGEQIIEKVIEKRIIFVNKVIENMPQKFGEELTEMLKEFGKAIDKLLSGDDK